MISTRNRNRISVGVSTLLALVVAVAVLRLRVQSVEVMGTSRIEPEELMAVVHPWLDQPLIALDADEIAEALYERFPLRDLMLEVQWPDRLVVRVIERTPVMWLLTDRGIYGLDADGYRLDMIRADAEAPAVMVEGCLYQRIRVTECTLRAADLYRQMHEAAVPLDRLSTISLDDQTATLWFAGPLMVRLGSAQDIGTKLDIMVRTLAWLEGRGHTLRRLDLMDPRYPVAQLTQSVM